MPSQQPYLSGDANLDGTVDGLDFSAWNADKFTATVAWTAGNYSADSMVDGLDFTIWNSFKFQSADGSSVTLPGPFISPWLAFVAFLIARGKCPWLAQDAPSCACASRG